VYPWGKGWLKINVYPKVVFHQIQER
jgi:hypothetical protein